MPLLTSSPLRKRPIFSRSGRSNHSQDLDNYILSQSSFSSPLRRQPTMSKDDVSFPATLLSFSPSFDAQPPLHTPDRQAHHGRARLTSGSSLYSMAPPPDTASTVSVGTKRKCDTPLRTPLSISTPESNSAHRRLDRLAPPPPPRFTSRTPSSKAETEVHLIRQTDTMTQLRICDLDGSDDESLPPFSASGRLERLQVDDDNSQDTIKDVSPDGHVTKRRARHRPTPDLLDSPPLKATQKAEETHRRHFRRLSNDGSPRPASHQSPILFKPTPPHAPPLPRPLLQPRAPMSRLDSGTLFFGPMIAQPPRLPSQNRRPHADPSNSWTTISSQPKTPSPRSSPSVWDEEDIFFGVGPSVATDASFLFNVAGSSPLTPSTRKVALPKKYRPRDSGVALSGSEEEREEEDEDDEDEEARSPRRSHLRVATIPASSNSTSTMCSSDGDREALTTPDDEPSLDSGWPATQCESDSEDEDASFGKVDRFIMKTLVAGGKGHQDGGSVGSLNGARDAVGIAWKKPPETPVKRVKMRDLSGTERPWQSAVTKRVDAFGYGVPAGGTRKPPRKSLPAAFPISAKGALSPAARKGKNMEDKENMPLSRYPIDGEDTDDEGLDSPSLRKEGRHSKGPMGLGRIADGKLSSSNWLIRRNSSGVYSTESEGSYGTPTRLNKSPDWPLPHERSPTAHLPAPRSSPGGRFERDFVEVNELGSGEFGRVIKAKWKRGGSEEMFAIKKSKRYEGTRHRLRLREEVDVLKHVGQCAPSGGHENVLGYIDSWEQDECLWIRTELCALGNFARFLWEFGRAFPRLDEGRVWKIVVELSNGLKFIHDCGVIHLDLKPANIFMTERGRFKIGDFGMAAFWPRKNDGLFEREGDKMYLAPEVLQGVYGQAADVFSLGMTLLETASNIVVPDQGEAWHRLRQEDFSQVDLDSSPELLSLIQSMMRTEPDARVNAEAICSHEVVTRTRRAMERKRKEEEEERGGGGDGVVETGFAGSPLSGVPRCFLMEILGRPGCRSGGNGGGGEDEERREGRMGINDVCW